MSSGSKLVNGESKKEKVHGLEHGNRKENESGAAGGTASSILVLAGDTSNAAAITNASDSDNNACGACVAGLTAGGVLGGVEYRDVDTSGLETPEDHRREEDADDQFVDHFQDAYSSSATAAGCPVETTPIVDLTATIEHRVYEEHQQDDDDDDDDDDVDEDDEDDEDEDDEDDNMVAAMNEHLSTTVSTTTSNSVVVNQNNSRNDFQNDEDGKPAAAGILSFPCDFDHMYASMTDGAAPAAATATSALGVSPLRGNEPRHNDLTEVKHLKELLLLHLDLIQQQSEQIVTKDKLLAALRQENETLKLRLERMDRRVNLQKLRSESNENSITSEHIGTCSPPSINSVNVPSTSELHRNIQPENNNSQYNESFKIRLNTSGGITTVKQEPNDSQAKHETKLESGGDIRLEWEEKKKKRLDPIPLSSGSKRKRGVSCSSTISNDTSSTGQDKPLTHESGRKSDRKGKLLAKKESFLTTEEHYYTAVGDPNYTLSLKEPSPVESDTSLEVPNWRVKLYTSCYTMEGTENLDDEIFNKRHLKLENDERRRKRWDVQRIREQRHIEKLKQRQERQNHQATCYNTNHTGPCPSTVEEEAVSSLWPDIEQIQSLQVDPQLPVTAFGAPIPSFTPSEFSLPWSNMSRTISRRPKRSTGRRKTTRR